MSLTIMAFGNEQGPAGQRCVRMALKRHKVIKRPKALKGDDRIGLMKLFPAFFTKALQKHYKALRTDRRTDGPTDRPTDGRTHALIEMRGRI